MKSVPLVRSALLVVALAFGVGASLSGACGGRSLGTSHPDGGAAGSGAGTTGAAGSSTATGSAGTATATGEGTGSAGTTVGAAGDTASGVAGTGMPTDTGVGGSSAGGTGGASAAGGGGGHAATGGSPGQGGAGGAQACGPCPPASCKDGFMQVVDPTISCCPICRPINCATVDCAAVTCPPGSHTEVPTGQCCPTCVMGQSQACNQAQMSYERDRETALEKYGESGCQVDGDCQLVDEANTCQQHCDVALPVSTVTFYLSFLDIDGGACDTACTPVSFPACPPYVAVCSNGQCVALPTAR